MAFRTLRNSMLVLLMMGHSIVMASNCEYLFGENIPSGQHGFYLDVLNDVSREKLDKIIQPSEFAEEWNYLKNIEYTPTSITAGTTQKRIRPGFMGDQKNPDSFLAFTHLSLKDFLTFDGPLTGPIVRFMSSHARVKEFLSGPETYEVTIVLDHFRQGAYSSLHDRQGWHTDSFDAITLSLSSAPQGIANTGYLKYPGREVHEQIVKIYERDTYGKAINISNGDIYGKWPVFIEPAHPGRIHFISNVVSHTRMPAKTDGYRIFVRILARGRTTYNPDSP